MRFPILMQYARLKPNNNLNKDLNRKTAAQAKRTMQRNHKEANTLAQAAYYLRAH